MAKSATITLTTAGADTGPFNLFSNVDSYSTPFETNISRASLVGGYTTNLVPDFANTIRVKSAGNCTNSIDFTFPYGIDNCGFGNTILDACSMAANNPVRLYSTCELLGVGCILYSNSNLTSPVTAPFVFAQASWDMNGSGVITGLSSLQC